MSDLVSTKSARILFASWHCLADPASGAAISMRDLLAGLKGFSWRTKVFTGPRLDFSAEDSMGRHLKNQEIVYEQKSHHEGELGFSLFHYHNAGADSTIFQPDSPPGPSQETEAAAMFLALFERVLETFQPDVLLTYGGGQTGWEMMKLARQRGVRVVFTLRNFSYRDARFFKNVDAILVPSEFSAAHYRKILGRDCTAIPSPIDWSRIRCEPNAEERRFATFVNPQPVKGVTVFARIALELGKRRPDIPLLVVEGRGQTDWLSRLPVDLSELENLHVMANTPDARDFYRVTRVMLMPSLWNESFGRVAAESSINGIPVLASNRGALPELLAESGFLFEIPSRYTPKTAACPTAEEIAPWIEKIIRLWDDEEFYEEQSRAARWAANAFDPERVFTRHDAFFRGLLG